MTRWRKPHLRVPGYIHGLVGKIAQSCGTFANPELLAFRMDGPPCPLYRVRFQMRYGHEYRQLARSRRSNGSDTGPSFCSHVWEGYEGGGAHSEDTVDVEIYQHWLVKCTQQDYADQVRRFGRGGRWSMYSLVLHYDCTIGCQGAQY